MTVASDSARVKASIIAKSQQGLRAWVIKERRGDTVISCMVQELKLGA